TSFVAALPQKLLANGALAVISHVDRAWGFSIQAADAGPQIQSFRNLLLRLMVGVPVGHATVDFNQNYATASANLLSLLDPSRPGAKAATDKQLVWAWAERNDAQTYTVLGDPAVRLRVTDLAAPATAATVPSAVGAAAPKPKRGRGVHFDTPPGFIDETDYTFH